MIVTKDNNDGDQEKFDRWSENIVTPIAMASGLAVAGGLMYTYFQADLLTISQPLITALTTSFSLAAGGLATIIPFSIGERIASAFAGFTQTDLDLRDATTEQLQDFYETEDPVEIARQIAIETHDQNGSATNAAIGLSSVSMVLSLTR